MFVCLSVGQHQRPAALARPVLLLHSSSSSMHRPRQRTVLLLRSSSRLLCSSSKVKAGQWVTPNPTRPTILDRIC